MLPISSGGTELLKINFPTGYEVPNKNVIKSENFVGLPGDDSFFENLGSKFRKDLGDKIYPEFQQMLIEATDTDKTVKKVLDNDRKTIIFWWRKN